MANTYIHSHRQHGPRQILLTLEASKFLIAEIFWAWIAQTHQPPFLFSFIFIIKIIKS